jgi:opacity protein-like surface antigen
MWSRLTAAMLVVLSTSAQAADLVLLCPITITQGASHHSVKRRYEINYDTHKVAEYIDQGNGWTLEAMLELQVADHDRLVFAGGGIKASNIDQHTGQYRQVDGRGKAQGTCEKTAGNRLHKF